MKLWAKIDQTRRNHPKRPSTIQCSREKSKIEKTKPPNIIEMRWDGRVSSEMHSLAAVWQFARQNKKLVGWARFDENPFFLKVFAAITLFGGFKVGDFHTFWLQFYAGSTIYKLLQFLSQTRIFSFPQVTCNVWANCVLFGTKRWGYSSQCLPKIFDISDYSKFLTWTDEIYFFGMKVSDLV